MKDPERTALNSLVLAMRVQIAALTEDERVPNGPGPRPHKDDLARIVTNKTVVRDARGRYFRQRP